MKEYALYQAAKSHFQDAPRYLWPDEALRRHEAAALEHWRAVLAEDVAFHTAVQYWFFTQWTAFKDYTNARGVKLIGDLPIYVSRTVPTSGASGSNFCWTGRGCPPRWRGCRRTTSPPTASSGAILSITGAP